MAKFFLSRRYRPNIWPFWVQLAIEFCLTVALLAFVGIASPDLYRTRLWQDGADNGFNSSPAAGLYAAANYRPYTTPRVWSQLYVDLHHNRYRLSNANIASSITNYELVIVVLSMFLMLTKSTMYILHVFPPIVSVFLHSVLIILYAVSAAYQSGSDMSDPKHPQPGAPWYITKSCSVTKYSRNVGYCHQAKATFWCTIVMLLVFVSYWIIAAWSCIPSKQQKAQYEEKQRLKKEKWAMLESPEDKYAPPTASHFGALNPMTPRTLAFNTLGGTTNQSFHTKTPNPINGKSPAFQEQEIQGEASGSGYRNSSGSHAPMYFPPPPKMSTHAI